MSNKYFNFYEPNTLHKENTTSDCVIRALTKALNKSWLEVFDELVPIAREKMTMLNNPECYSEYLEQNGFVRVKISVKKGHKRPTPLTFTKTHKTGTYILSLAHHIVCSKDGIYYDVWDCGDNCVYTYWEKIN